MNEAQGKPEDSNRTSRKMIVIVLGVVAAAALAVVAVNRNRGGNGGNNGPTGEQAELLELTRTALAATENLATEEADPLWNQIVQITPDDRSAALNRALNRALHVDRLAATAIDSSAETAEKQSARERFPNAVEAARSSIDDYEQLSADTGIPLWLRCRIDYHYANLLPSSMKQSSLRTLFDTLVSAISGGLSDSPDSIMLAGLLSDVLAKLEVSAGLPPELRAQAVDVVSKLAADNPDNLFLAIQAARLNVAAKNDQASKWVLRTQELCRAIDPSLSPSLAPIGYTAPEIVEAINTSIAEERWEDANRDLNFWFNVINPTEIMKTDRRLASPHPLDRISFDSLRQLSAEVVAENPIAQSEVDVRFLSSSIDQAENVRWIKPFDFDLDLDDDLVTINNDNTLQLWRNDGQSNWSAAGQLDLGITAAGMIIADLFMVDESHPDRLRTEGSTGTYRHDAFPSIVVYGEAGVGVISVDGRPSTPDEDRLAVLERTGLERVSGVTTLASGDLDGDGDLDLVVATSEGLRLFVNRGSRNFFEISHQPGLESDAPIEAMAIVDLDRDLDLDVVTLQGESGQVGLLENLRHLQFRSRGLQGIPSLEDGSYLGVADVDANVSWDIVVGGPNASMIVFSQTADAGNWTVDRVERIDQPLSEGLLADIDNDSWLDLLSGTSPTMIRPIGPWGFGANSSVIDDAITQYTAANLDGNGLLDLVALHDSTPTVMLNQTQTDNHFISIRFRGIADNAANSGRVNHFGIGSVLELRFGPHYRSRVITSPETHFGLGSFAQADSVRVILPNGLSQTIRQPSVDQVVEEEQKLKGSCPYLYAWDGEKFVFVTDCLWAAPLGLQVASGVVAKDRPWEYLKIDGSQIQPRGESYEFRITEELWEIAYLDQIAMTAVDRPADVEIWTNEKVGPGSIATPRIFAFRRDELHELERASDTLGRDVTAQLMTQDRDFVQGFDRRIRQGLCPPHWIDLDFGELGIAAASQAADDQVNPVSPSVYLVITGWILPTDTSLNIQIDQNPELQAVEFPSLWVPDPTEQGGWRNAIPFMGFPGGKTKTIVVDVTDVLVADDPRLRIRTSAQIYWDSAKLAVQSNPPTVQTHQLDLQHAEVAFHGFSSRIAGGPRQPEDYHYDAATKDAIWPPLKGVLTQFGDHTDLVRQWDDAMIVIGSGDEVQLRFSVPDPDVPAGWRRDFVLHCVGWDKDADLNTLAGQTTGPLPFREMSTYPPGLDDQRAAQQVERINRSHLRREQSFRSFWYRGGEAPKSGFID